MEKVASHINEMQKIYEDYGAVFDQLVAEQSGTEKEVQLRHSLNAQGWYPDLTPHSVLSLRRFFLTGHRDFYGTVPHAFLCDLAQPAPIAGPHEKGSWAHCFWWGFSHEILIY